MSCSRVQVPFTHSQPVQFSIGTRVSKSGRLSAENSRSARSKGAFQSASSAGADKVDLAPIVINELTVIGSRCGPFAKALDALGADRVDVVSLIGRRMKLSAGVELLKAARKPGVIKVLLEP